jgi:hypothetical protein
MADDSNNLRETLARLHEQLRAAPDLSAETRTQLQSVVADIHALLEQEPPASTSSPAAPLRAVQQASIVARLGSA